MYNETNLAKLLLLRLGDIRKLHDFSEYFPLFVLVRLNCAYSGRRIALMFPLQVVLIWFYYECRLLNQ